MSMYVLYTILNSIKLFYVFGDLIEYSGEQMYEGEIEYGPFNVLCRSCYEYFCTPLERMW